MNLRSLVPFRDRPNLARPELNPFGSLQREIDRLFEDFTRGFGALAPQGAGTLVPSIDVTETDNEIEITAELPGLERKDVEISLDGNVLTIRGEKKVELESGDGVKGEKAGKGDKDKAAQGAQSENGHKNYHVAERSYGVFLRMLELPQGLDPSDIQATMANGVLKIKIPKPQRVQPKKIEVKEAA
jgi:HSP20 family protein